MFILFSKVKENANPQGAVAGRAMEGSDSLFVS